MSRTPRIDPGKLYFKRCYRMTRTHENCRGCWCHYIIYDPTTKTITRVKAKDLKTPIFVSYCSRSLAEYYSLLCETYEETMRKITNQGWIRIIPAYLQLDEGI